MDVNETACGWRSESIVGAVARGMRENMGDGVIVQEIQRVGEY